jgi:glucose-6-phosphate 1-dehydrogenase
MNESEFLLDIILDKPIHPSLTLSYFSFPSLKKKLLVLVIGASGDLAKNKTYPALFQLWKAHLLPKHLKVWGYARTVKSHHELHLYLRPYLLRSIHNDTGTNKEKRALVDKFLSICFYHAGKSYGEGPLISISRTLPFTICSCT